MDNTTAPNTPAIPLNYRRKTKQVSVADVEYLAQKLTSLEKRLAKLEKVKK